MSTEPSSIRTRGEDEEAAMRSVPLDTEDGRTPIADNPSEHGEQPNSGTDSDSEASEYSVLPG